MKVFNFELATTLTVGADYVGSQLGVYNCLITNSGGVPRTVSLTVRGQGGTLIPFTLASGLSVSLEKVPVVDLLLKSSGAGVMVLAWRVS